MGQEMLKKFFLCFAVFLLASNVTIVYAKPTSLNVYVTNLRNHPVKVKKGSFIYEELPKPKKPLVINKTKIVSSESILVSGPLDLNILASNPPLSTNHAFGYPLSSYEFLFKDLTVFSFFLSHQLSVTLEPDHQGNRNKFLRVKLSKQSEIFAIKNLKNTVDIYVVADDCWYFYLKNDGVILDSVR